MPRKKSVKKSVCHFISKADEIRAFICSARRSFSDLHISFAYGYGILRLYREFESMILDVLVGSVNNDTTTIASTTGVKFPKHLTDEVCEYLITGNRYFDFKGRDGLIQIIKKYVPNDHYLLEAVKDPRYKDSIEKLAALRNLAAHNSQLSKQRAKKAIGQTRMSSEVGAWLKKQNRLEKIIDDLKNLANEICTNAPY